MDPCPPIFLYLHDNAASRRLCSVFFGGLPASKNERLLGERARSRQCDDDDDETRHRNGDHSDSVDAVILMRRALCVWKNVPCFVWMATLCGWALGV